MRRYSTDGAPGAAAPIERDRLDAVEGNAVRKSDGRRIQIAVAVEIERHVVACSVVVDGDGGSFGRVVGMAADREEASLLDVAGKFACSTRETNAGASAADSDDAESGNDPQDGYGDN
jgi:hypothetical protein